MKQLLITIAVLVLVGCDESQQSATTPEAKPIARVAGAKAPDISIEEAAMDGDIEAVKQHLAAGADVNAVGIHWGTPLQFAAKAGHKEVVELLIAKGADVNANREGETTPLHRAAEYGHLETAKLLIAKGVDVNAKCVGDNTPLHSAAERGHKEIAELLLAEGADVNAKGNIFHINIVGWTPLDWVIYNGEIEFAELLRKHGGKSGALDSIHIAAFLGNIEAVKQNLAAGADVNARMLVAILL